MNYPFCVDYFRDEAHETSVTELLSELDTNSETVDAHFSSLRHMPMGKYFEQLVLFILDKDPRYKVFLANHQIMDDKRTIGELDIILKDLETGSIEHWELCLKFYLQSKPSTDQQLMLGPGAKDNMDRKVRKLIEHQMKLSEHPSIKYLVGTENIKSKLFMKGQLFYHLGKQKTVAVDTNSFHDYGSWCYISEVNEMLDASLKWITLSKPDWIGTADGYVSGLLTKREMIQYLEGHFANDSQPVLCAALKTTDKGCIEASRCFVVSNHWPRGIAQS